MAPVLSAVGEVTYYLPAGRWTNPWGREGVVLVAADRADCGHADDPVVTVHPGDVDGARLVAHPDTGEVRTFAVRRAGPTDDGEAQLTR